MSDRQRIGSVATALSVASVLAAFAPAASAAPVLYGATGVGTLESGTPPPSNLYAINPDTGAASTVGPIGFAVTGMAVDPTSGTLYGVTAGVQLGGTPRQLITINRSSGAGTVVASIGVNEIEDIAFNNRGQLYGWNETGDDLATIDKTAGTVLNIRNSGLGVTFGSAISFDRDGQLWG